MVATAALSVSCGGVSVCITLGVGLCITLRVEAFSQLALAVSVGRELLVRVCGAATACPELLRI